MIIGYEIFPKQLSPGDDAIIRASGQFDNPKFPGYGANLLGALSPIKEILKFIGTAKVPSNHYDNSRRPSSDFSRVTSSAYSRALPMGKP
jgi:hypothetical protein